MVFNMRMFDPVNRVAVVKSRGYDSILKHSHEFVELFFVEKGKGIQEIGNERFPVSENELYVISGKEEHSIRPDCEEENFRIVNIIFDPSVTAFDLSVFSFRDAVRAGENDRIRSLISAMYRIYTDKGLYYGDFLIGYLNLLLAECAVQIHSQGRKGASAQNLTRKINASYVDRTVEYLQENYANKITLSDIQREVGLSVGYLQKLFREERKTSIINYLLRYRIEKACQLLLETDLSVREISERVGFSDLKNFYTAFKKIVHTSPNAYRMR